MSAGPLTVGRRRSYLAAGALLLAAALTVAACGGSSEGADPDPDPEVEEVHTDRLQCGASDDPLARTGFEWLDDDRPTAADPEDAARQAFDDVKERGILPSVPDQIGESSSNPGWWGDRQQQAQIEQVGTRYVAIQVRACVPAR